MGLVDSVGRGSSSVIGISGPLAVAVEPMSVAISKAETLSRPVSGGDGVSRVDCHSAVEGLSAPLAVVATVVEAGVKTGDLLVRPAGGMGLADSVLGGVLVAVDIVVVLKSGNGCPIEGLSAPLAVARVELSPLLVASSSSGMRLANGVAVGQLMSMSVVAVLKGGGKGDSVANSVSVRGRSLADTVAVGSVDSGAGAVAVVGRRPGAEPAGGELVAVEGFS